MYIYLYTCCLIVHLQLTYSVIWPSTLGQGKKLTKPVVLFPISFQGSLAQVFPVPSTPSPSPELIPFPSPVTLRIPCSFLSLHNVLWAQLLCLSSGSLSGPSGLSAALLWFNTQGYNCPSCSFSNHTVHSEGRTTLVVWGHSLCQGNKQLSCE